MAKKGMMIYAPRNLLDLEEQIRFENNFKKSKSLNKVVEYAKVGKEIERLLKKVGYL